MTYFINRKMVGMAQREGGKRQSQEKREGGSGMGEGALPREGGLYLHICAGSSSS